MASILLGVVCGEEDGLGFGGGWLFPAGCYWRMTLSSGLSTSWENIDGCTTSYRCDTALFFLLMLSHAYQITIDRVIGAPGHGKDVMDR